MKNTKILVTGGAGFVGSNLVQQLLEDNNEVVVLDNLSSGHYSNLSHSGDLNFINGDLRNIEDVRKAVSGVEVVFHLAASVGNKRSLDFPIEDSQTNVLGTINLLEQCVKHGVRKIVCSSSAGVYGELKTIPIKEDHPIEPDTPYGCSKLAAEKLCLSYSKLYDLEAICLRYFNVYGPKQRYDAYGNVIPIFVFKMLADEGITVFGDGLQTRDFVHVRDVVQANIRSAESLGVNGAFNIASGVSISINELVEDLSVNYLGGIRVDYLDRRPGDVLHSLADISKARDNISFVPKVSLKSGIAEYVDWARSFYLK